MSQHVDTSKDWMIWAGLAAIVITAFAVGMIAGMMLHGAICQ